MKSWRRAVNITDMTETPFTNRELDHYFKDIRSDISEIKEQTKKTNGVVTMHTKVLLVFGTALTVLLITNGSELIKVFKLII